MHREIDDEIDRLYQLPLAEFTAARNALAKRAGPDAGAVRKLAKPPLAAWAVNQLHWKDRRVYEELTTAAQALRTVHTAVLSGRKGDIRSVDAEHDKAVERALKAALGILTESGHPATDATRQAILQTLRALSVDEPPGRLSKTLQPGGFEMLAGIQTAPGGRGAATEPVKERGTRQQESARQAAPKAETAQRAKQEERRAKREEAARRAKQENEEKQAAKRAREAHAAAERALRDAEQAARRGEFEVARAEREADRAQKRLTELHRELEAARKRVAAAKQELEQLGVTR